jgi:tetratricopeptide (TPR) repeat protein
MRGLGEYDQSAGCVDRLLAIAEQNKGQSLPMVGAALADVCVTYSKQGRIKESEEVGEKAIRLLQQAPDDGYFDNSSAMVAIAMNNLGAVYSLGCKYDRAHELFKRSLEMKKRVMPEGDSSIGESYGNVACALLILEKYDEALENAVKANEIFEAVGPKSSWAVVQQIMGDAYRGLGNLVESEAKLTTAISVQEELFAPGDPTLAETFRDLGKLFRDKGDYEKAQNYFNKAMTIFENSVGANHPQIARTLEECCKLYKAAGNESELDKAEVRIAEILQHQS